jgi:predicted anti-sigma-YlaC factor YlaD
MNAHKHDEGLLQELRKQFGNDIDAEIIEDVARHMKDCPDCKIYVDSVQQTVKIYRVTETEKSVPEGVSERLFKTLKLKRNPS